MQPFKDMFLYHFPRCTHLVFYLQRKRTDPPPPNLTDPAIIEWSKPCLPEQWARRSPEWNSHRARA